MKNTSSLEPKTRPNGKVLAVLLGTAFLCGFTLNAAADVPAWLREAANTPTPQYKEEMDAVLLLDEMITTVNDKGEIKTTYRQAYKILRPQGRDHGHVVVHFDKETRLTFLKGWCIPAQGKEYEVKEKDALEASAFSGALYEDNRLKILSIPAAEPGNVIGYEYEQRRRPLTLQDRWLFQDPHPVRKARYVLQLPPGWEFTAFWANHPSQEPRRIGENQWVWELESLPEVELEPQMPPWHAVAGWLAVTFLPPEAKLGGKTHTTWGDVGQWYYGLASSRRQLTPEIKQKVVELTSSAPATLNKIKALAAFAQRDIRYVAIEIGIGSHQPHPAQDVFINRYGDCKDKATLLATMLQEIGIESHYVLIHSERGIVRPEFPTPLTFNHVILAIRLPDDVDTNGLFALAEGTARGKLLFFDPTSTMTPLGYLPPSLQANYGLLVTPDGGELVQLPLLAPSTNRLMRTAKLSLSSNGTLSGEVYEVRWGSPASQRRAAFLDEKVPDRAKVLENFLATFLPGFLLTGAQVENLEKLDSSLILKYRFVAERYGQAAGNLLLFRPRVLGGKGSSLMEIKERKHPVEFDDATVQTDQFEIALPQGYAVDELPAPIHVEYPFAEYESSIELKGNVLHYSRTYRIKEIRVPTERLDELKKFYRSIAADERSSAVLKRTLP